MVVTSMGYCVGFYRTKNNIKESNGFILALPKTITKQNNKVEIMGAHCLKITLKFVCVVTG